jgi:hypothetical protein
MDSLPDIVQEISMNGSFLISSVAGQDAEETVMAYKPNGRLEGPSGTRHPHTDLLAEMCACVKQPLLRTCIQ